MARRAFPATLAWLLLCVAAAVLGPAVRAAETGQDADLRSIDPARHVEFLSTHGSRYTGYPGCAEAEKYIVQQFKDIGLANVEESPFQVVVPVVPADDRWGKKVTPEQAAQVCPTGGTLTVADQRGAPLLRDAQLRAHPHDGGEGHLRGPDLGRGRIPERLQRQDG